MLPTSSGTDFAALGCGGQQVLARRRNRRPVELALPGTRRGDAGQMSEFSMKCSAGDRPSRPSDLVLGGRRRRRRPPRPPR